MRYPNTKILSTLDKLADLDFQRAVWINQAYFDEVLNFGEAVNLLDDYNFFDAIEHQDIKLKTVDDQQKLASFANALLEYKEPFERTKILTDPSWLSIVREAAHIRVLLEM
ncbi:hypothetical protein JMG10_02655 [Nostoc ellipsosporum NOK]|nr:hypothetical protein [Nostoc ellipsosporum NOK]